MSYDMWKLGTYAGYAESGWFWTELREGICAEHSAVRSQ